MLWRLQDREALARLQRMFAARTEVARFGVNVNQAGGAELDRGPGWMGRAMARVGYSINVLDEVIAEVDRRLR